ncbi:HlyD family type I secretion periplasmic adaptor subunit [Rhodovulum sp. YNF3179]|uniref:HlyD family type I secretion periplasmic adaptor subunit n=1 Tax=Rhodovulum sp. YNF3179 TaxID=3425127 RepID=UPI003D3355C2
MTEKKAANGTGQKTYSITGHVISGVVICGLLGAAVFGWAARAELSGAVVVPGEVSVDRDLRVVQHRDGGIVGDIVVDVGDTVAKGDVLLRLDDAAARTEKAILHDKIVELSIRLSRLEAERDLHARFELPAGLGQFDVSAAEIAAIHAGERRIFEGKMASFTSQREQLELSIDQVNVEIEGLDSRLDAKEDEIGLVSAENARIESLTTRKLKAQNALFSINREHVRLIGERGEIVSALGRARSRVSELELQILSLADTVRTDAQREIREIETKLSELNERRLVIEDTLSRTEIRAPIAGRINDLNVNSIGGVITPAQVLATIVPADAELVFKGQVPAVQIEQVTVGRPARMRFPAFEQSKTPEIFGTVDYVAAAATTPEKNAPGAVYAVTVETPAAELARLGGRALRPGMPVELYITTEERTALSYLVKPFQDQLARAFRER